MALPSVASASEMAPPTARAGSSRERVWADRAPWGLQTLPRIGAQQGTAPGAGTRRGVPIWDASIRLVQWHSPRGLEIDNARDSGVGDSPVWVKVQSGDLDKLTSLGTITPWSSG